MGLYIPQRALARIEISFAFKAFIKSTNDDKSSQNSNNGTSTHTIPPLHQFSTPDLRPLPRSLTTTPRPLRLPLSHPPTISPHLPSNGHPRPIQSRPSPAAPHSSRWHGLHCTYMLSQNQSDLLIVLSICRRLAFEEKRSSYQP